MLYGARGMRHGVDAPSECLVALGGSLGPGSAGVPRAFLPHGLALSLPTRGSSDGAASWHWSPFGLSTRVRPVPALARWAVGRGLLLPRALVGGRTVVRV